MADDSSSLKISSEQLFKYIIGVLVFVALSWGGYQQTVANNHESRIDQLEKNEIRTQMTERKLEEALDMQRQILTELDTVQRCLVRMSANSPCAAYE